MTPEPAYAPVAPALLVRSPDAERTLQAGRNYVIGRDGKVMAVLRERHAGAIDLGQAGAIVRRLLG